MWRRFAPSARWRRVIANGTAGLGVAAVVAVGLGIDDSVVTQVDARTTGLWLQLESTGELVLVDLATGIGVNRVVVTDPGVPVDVIDSESLVGVVERTSGNLITVDPALGKVISRAPLGIDESTDVIVADDAWVVGSTGVARVPLDGTEPDLIEVAGPSTSAARNDNGVALAIDGMRVDVDSRGASTATDRYDRLAVANVGDSVATIMPSDESVTLADGRSACVDPDLGTGTVWGGSVSGTAVVAGAHGPGGTVHVSDLDDGSCRIYEVADEPTEFSQPLIVDDVLYVVDTTVGRLHTIDLEDDVERTVSLFRAGEPVELIPFEDEVVGHEPRTNRGAIFGPDGVSQLIDKSAGQPLVTVASADSSVVIAGGDDAAVATTGAEGGEFSGDTILDDPVVLGSGEVTQLEESAEELVANFAFSASVVQVGVPVTFVDESSGSPESWTWDFGDGTNANGPRVEHAWSTPGTFPVTLIIDRDGETDSRTALIEVVPAETVLAPTADFSFSAATIEVDETVTLTDQSVGEVTERRWDFGDGTTGSDEVVSKSWSEPGEYVVTLTVANAAGGDTTSATITVVDRLQPPIAVISVDATTVEVGQSVRLRSVSSGDVARVSWNLGDGNFASTAQVIHSYSETGSYTVRLTVSNSAGQDSATQVITVAETTDPPDARIAPIVGTVEVGIPVTLTSISLNNPDTLEWEFGDGNSAQGTTVTHTWAGPGDYGVTLTATNEAGSDSTNLTVTVLPYLPPPIASFTSPLEVRVGTPAEFVDTSSNGSTYFWDFGDGGSATTMSAIHTYATTGPKVVSLTVTNRNGTETATDTVTVLPTLPVAGFTFSPTVVRANQTVFFTDTSTGAATYSWTFGDGGVSTLASPTHSFSLPGTYIVTQTVSNSIGETSSLPQTIIVSPAPPALGPITASRSPGITLSPVTFTVSPAVGSGPINSYTWNFGDGSPPQTTPPGFGGTGSATHTFSTSGPRTVTVTASGFLPGDSAIASLPFTVVDPPLPNINVVPPPPPVELNETVPISAVPALGSGPITSYFFDFGDGTSTTVLEDGIPGATVSKAWGSLGSKTVTVTAFGPVPGAQDVVSIPVNVVPPPPPDIASATATPNPAFTGRVTNFAATLAGTSGPVNSWLWTFGDGTSSTLQNPSKTYTAPGDYTVTVRATGPVTFDETSFPLTVKIPPPVLNTPTYSPSVPLVGGAPGDNVVTFSVTAAPNSGPISSYLWTFHDLTTSPLANPTYVYPATGPYNVSVVASGPGGSSTPANVTVWVYSPINANFTHSQPGPPGSPVFFTDTSSGAPAVSWFWQFGDGFTSTLQHPSHTYAAPGPYTVTLQVTDGMGRPDSHNANINVS